MKRKAVVRLLAGTLCTATMAGSILPDTAVAYAKENPVGTVETATQEETSDTDKKPEGFFIKFKRKRFILKYLPQQSFQPDKPFSDFFRFLRLSAGYRQGLCHFQIQQIFYKILPRGFIDSV